MSGFTEHDVADQSGRCFIVTGANTGIGFEAARVLAGKGARVLLACRDKGKADEAIAAIRAGHPDADVVHLPLDLADLDSVRRAADIAAAEPRIDVLVNNAGVMFPPLSHTRQGFELQWGVNHLGPFALTALLLPKMAETPGSRVVVTSSLAHSGGNIQWDDLNATRSYKKTARYCDSKLANMLHFAELDRRLRAAGSPVTALGCHPGMADTDLMRHLPAITNLFKPLARLFVGTAQSGAWPTLQAATDPGERGGEYYGPGGAGGRRGPSGLAKRSAAAQDAALARRLWDVSVEMTGVDPGLAPA